MINATGIAVAQGLGTACDTFFSQVQLIVLLSNRLFTPAITRASAIAMVSMIAIVFYGVNITKIGTESIMSYILQYKNRNTPRNHNRNCSTNRRCKFTLRVLLRGTKTNAKICF